MKWYWRHRWVDDMSENQSAGWFGKGGRGGGEGHARLVTY